MTKEVNMTVNELTKIISPAFTEETVFEILRTQSGFSELKILDIVIDKEKSKKGDSYLSTICRFKVRAKGKKTSGESQEFTVPVIVKYFLKNVSRQKTFRSADFFKTEIYFYEKVWPEMKEFKLAHIPDEPDEIPLLLAAYCDGKNDFVALEDLSYHGFVSSSRNDVINKDKLVLFLQALAKFHAVGIVLKLKNPEFKSTARNLPESYFSEKLKPWYKNFMHNSMGTQYQKAVKELLPSKYYDKITKLFAGDFYGQIVKCCNVHDKFSTVTEGDAWLPNFLAKPGNNGDNFSAVLIDFQLARYAPLTNDILHFLLISVPENMLNEWDELIAEYHKCLSSTIGLLGGDKNFITLKELQEELRQYPFVGVIMTMESLVMSLLTDEEVVDLDMLEGENAYPLEDVWLLPEFNGARQEKMASLVKHCVDKGFIP